MTISVLPQKAVARRACRRCEEFPDALEGPGTIHLSFPLSHSRAKILNYFYESSHDCVQNGEVLSIDAPTHDLTPILLPLREVLTSVEQSDVRVFFQPEGRELRYCVDRQVFLRVFKRFGNKKPDRKAASISKRRKPDAAVFSSPRR